MGVERLEKRGVSRRDFFEAVSIRGLFVAILLGAQLGFAQVAGVFAETTNPLFVMYQVNPLWRGLCYDQLVNFTTAMPEIKFLWMAVPPADEWGTWEDYWKIAWDDQNPRARPFVTSLIDQGHWVGMKGVYIPMDWVTQGLVPDNDPEQDIRSLDYQHKLYAISEGKKRLEHLFGRPITIGGAKWCDQEILDAAYASGFKYWMFHDSTVEDHTRFGTTNFDFNGTQYDGHGMINLGYTEYYIGDLMNNSCTTLKAFFQYKLPISLVVHPKGWLSSYDEGKGVDAQELATFENYLQANYNGQYQHGFPQIQEAVNVRPSITSLPADMVMIMVMAATMVIVVVMVIVVIMVTQRYRPVR